MEYSYEAIDQIQTPGGNISCNAGSGDTLFIDASRSVGLGTSDIRAQVDDRGQDHGWLFPGGFLKAGQLIGLQGIVIIRSAATDPGYVTARDAFIDDMKTKLHSMLASTGTLHFAGGSTIGGIRPRAIGAPQSEVALGLSTKSLLIVLVSATPA